MKPLLTLWTVILLQFLIFERGISKDVQSLRCYECNVWKAGYGHLCDNPRIVSGCTVCMKIETTIYMGYYKNKPRSSTIITRLCGNDNTPHFGSECLHYRAADGTSRRCFCEGELCNAATKGPLGTMATVLLPVLTLLWVLTM